MKHAGVRPVRIALTFLLTMLLWPTAVGPAAAASQIELEWSADDCRFVIVLVPTDAETLQPYLPDGFTPTIPESEPLPPDPRMGAVLGYEVFRCGQQTIGGHTARPGTYGAVWTFVEPPDDLVDPERPLTFFKFRTLVPDDRQRQTLAGLDVSVLDGTGDMADMVVTDAGAVFGVGSTFEPSGVSYDATGAAQQPDALGGSFVEYSPLEGRDGFAAWRTDFGADRTFSGAGVLRWDDDAFAAEVLGTTESEAWMLAGDGLAFTNGSITVPRPGDAGPTPPCG